MPKCFQEHIEGAQCGTSQLVTLALLFWALSHLDQNLRSVPSHWLFLKDGNKIANAKKLSTPSPKKTFDPQWTREIAVCLFNHKRREGIGSHSRHFAERNTCVHVSKVLFLNSASMHGYHDDCGPCTESVQPIWRMCDSRHQFQTHFSSSKRLRVDSTTDLSTYACFLDIALQNSFTERVSRQTLASPERKTKVDHRNFFRPGRHSAFFHCVGTNQWVCLPKTYAL